MKSSGRLEFNCNTGNGFFFITRRMGLANLKVILVSTRDVA